MEENLNQASGIEQQTATPQPEVKEQPIDNSAESTLTTIAVVILIFGIIATLICAFTLMFVQDPEYHYIDSKVFNPAGFATTIEVLAGTLITWASLRVFANISITLKEINKKIK